MVLYLSLIFFVSKKNYFKLKIGYIFLFIVLNIL